VVLDAQALSEEAQRYIGSATTDGMGLVLALADGPRAMHLEPHLEALLEGRKVALPSLAERAEDLRALALHKLSRIGTRLRGKAFGISLQAQALLNEHDWPGNDAELDAVLLRAALATTGDVVDAAVLLQVIGRVESLSESGPQRAAH